MPRNLTIDISHKGVDLSYSLNCTRVVPPMPPTTPPAVIEFLRRTTRVVSITATQWQTLTKRLYCSVLRTAREDEEIGYNSDYRRLVARLKRDARKISSTPLDAFREFYISLIRSQGSINIEDDLGWDSVVLIIEGSDLVLMGGADNE